MYFQDCRISLGNFPGSELLTRQSQNYSNFDYVAIGLKGHRVCFEAFDYCCSGSESPHINTYDVSLTMVCGAYMLSIVNITLLCLAIVSSSNVCCDLFTGIYYEYIYFNQIGQHSLYR